MLPRVCFFKMCIKFTPSFRGECIRNIICKGLKIQNVSLAQRILSGFYSIFTEIDDKYIRNGSTNGRKCKIFKRSVRKCAHSCVFNYVGFYLISPPVEGKLHQKQRLQLIKVENTKIYPGRFDPSRVFLQDLFNRGYYIQKRVTHD